MGDFDFNEDDYAEQVFVYFLDLTMTRKKNSLRFFHEGQVRTQTGPGPDPLARVR